MGLGVRVRALRKLGSKTNTQGSKTLTPLLELSVTVADFWKACNEQLSFMASLSWRAARRVIVYRIILELK